VLKHSKKTAYVIPESDPRGTRVALGNDLPRRAYSSGKSEGTSGPA
jgi:hypothetical protein